MRKAVIDVGSNSLLLAVGEVDSGAVRSVFEDTRVTGLGEGVKATGSLSEAAMERTLAALAELWQEGLQNGAQSIRAAATMAARIAANSEEFQRRAAAQGTPIEILSGEDEAELGFRTVAEDPLFAPARRLSIVDPGGNSTELVTADRASNGWDVRFRRSFPVGTLGLRDGPMTGDPLDAAALLKGSEAVDRTLGLEFLPGACGAVCVLGATGTNLVTIREKMATWQPERVHGATLDFEEVSRAVGYLCRMTDAERAELAGIEKGRERTIHIGALILERFLHALHAPDVFVSVRGWRHAMLETMLSEPLP